MAHIGDITPAAATIGGVVHGVVDVFAGHVAVARDVRVRDFIALEICC